MSRYTADVVFQFDVATGRRPEKGVVVVQADDTSHARELVTAKANAYARQHLPGGTVAVLVTVGTYHRRRP